VIALMRRLEINFRSIATQLRIVFGNLATVVGTKGVAQVSAYVDQLLASLLPSGAVAEINSRSSACCR
jgi:peptidoglycan biosynthesis protein MviN/MurJ (putative lipid II flippase)